MISRVLDLKNPAPPLPASLDLDACYGYCEAIVRGKHENFPVASKFLPARLRPAVCALYAFARTADDIADEPRFEGRRAEELARWDDQLHRAFHGEADHPVFVALADTAQKYELPIAPFTDMLTAFRMDLVRHRWATFRELMDYVTRAAHPIGRLLLYVFGVRDPVRHRFADDLATALALTSFWQDTVRDLHRDRVYLPQEDLAHFGVAEADLFAHKQSRGLADLIRYETARTRAYYLRARPLLDAVADELRVELALFWHGGSRVLERVEARAGDLFGARPELSTVDKAWILAKALTRR